MTAYVPFKTAVKIQKTKNGSVLIKRFQRNCLQVQPVALFIFICLFLQWRDLEVCGRKRPSSPKSNGIWTVLIPLLLWRAFSTNHLGSLLSVWLGWDHGIVFCFSRTEICTKGWSRSDQNPKTCYGVVIQYALLALLRLLCLFYKSEELA